MFTSDLIKKYQEKYELVFEEAKFFLDLENILQDHNDLTVNFGYFIKFRTDTIEELKKNDYPSYVIKRNHIIALDLSRWELREIPNSIGLLSKLEYINLSGLALKELPESMKSLESLNFINLNGNNLTEIPIWLHKFCKENFSHKYVQDGVIPEDAVILSLLEVLNGRELKKLDLKIDVKKWESALNYKINNQGLIYGIYINDDHASQGIFPKAICKLRNIEELELIRSSIEFIPDCISQLQTLRYLDLSFNKIKAVPESITVLKSLESFNINYNEISETALLDLIWYKSGENFLDNHEFDKAIEQCESTLKIYPKHKNAWFHLGIAYKEKNEYIKAQKTFEKFLEIDPLNSTVWSLLSDTLHLQGNFVKAIEAIKCAIEIDLDAALLWSNLGLNYKKLGKYNDALEAYLHSIRIDSRNAKIWKDIASIYRDKGEYIKAIEAEEKALNIELTKNKNDL